MELFFQNVLNDDLNYYIFKILHNIQLNEVFDELFGEIRYIDILQGIIEEYDCNYYITYKRGKLIATIIYPMDINETAWIIYIG